MGGSVRNLRFCARFLLKISAGQPGSGSQRGFVAWREGEVERIPGYDGEYGTIRLFELGSLRRRKGR